MPAHDFYVGSAHSLLCRNEERKPGEESLRASHAANVATRPRSRTIWDKLSTISQTAASESLVGGLMVLAHQPTQSLGTRQPASFLVFSPPRLGREREALDPPTAHRLVWSRGLVG